MGVIMKSGYKESSLMSGITITGTRKLPKRSKGIDYVKRAEEVLNKFIAEKRWPENSKEYITVVRSACYCEKRKCSWPVLFLSFNGRISVLEQGESEYSKRVRYVAEKSEDNEIPTLDESDIDELCERISKEALFGMRVHVEFMVQMVREYKACFSVL